MRWLLGCLLLLSGCALGGKVASPDVDVASPKTTVDQDVVTDEGPAGGVVGQVGGGGDSVALWLAIAALAVVALSAYPVQRYGRLAWNSWRGKSGLQTRSRKGREMCVKFSEWDSLP